MSVGKATFELYREIVNGKTGEPLAEAINRLIVEVQAAPPCYRQWGQARMEPNVDADGWPWSCTNKMDGGVCPSCEARTKLKQRAQV